MHVYMHNALYNACIHALYIILCYAGILAGIKTCGVIVLLSELFTSESKTQVYGSLHQYFQQHPRLSETIGMGDCA